MYREEPRVEEERAFIELLRCETEGRKEGSELEADRREYAWLRRQNSRLMRKHGLEGTRGRG